MQSEGKIKTRWLEEQNKMGKKGRVRRGGEGIAGKSDVSNAYRWDAVVSVIAQIESRIFFAMVIRLLTKKRSS